MAIYSGQVSELGFGDLLRLKGASEDQRVHPYCSNRVF